MKRVSRHATLESLSWLEGTWRTEEQGSGKYPTIKDFNYCEEISFISIGQPMFNYTAQSWDPELKKPLHRETGFLRVNPENNKVSLILAHNVGLTTIEHGEIIDKTIILRNTDISRMEGAKPPQVTQVHLNSINMIINVNVNIILITRIAS